MIATVMISLGIVFTGHRCAHKYITFLSGLKSVNDAGTVTPVSDKVKILGATLDTNLTMEPHTKTLSSSCFYHIHSLKLICSFLDDSMSGSVASSLVSSHLDYVNYILYSTSLKNICAHRILTNF